MKQLSPLYVTLIGLSLACSLWSQEKEDRNTAKSKQSAGRTLVRKSQADMCANYQYHWKRYGADTKTFTNSHLGHLASICQEYLAKYPKGKKKSEIVAQLELLNDERASRGYRRIEVIDMATWRKRVQAQMKKGEIKVIQLPDGVKLDPNKPPTITLEMMQAARYPSELRRERELKEEARKKSERTQKLKPKITPSPELRKAPVKINQKTSREAAPSEIKNVEMSDGNRDAGGMNAIAVASVAGVMAVVFWVLCIMSFRKSRITK